MLPTMTAYIIFFAVLTVINLFLVVFAWKCRNDIRKQTAGQRSSNRRFFYRMVKAHYRIMKVIREAREKVKNADPKDLSANQ